MFHAQPFAYQLVADNFYYSSPIFNTSVLTHHAPTGYVHAEINSKSRAMLPPIEPIQMDNKIKLSSRIIRPSSMTIDGKKEVRVVALIDKICTSINVNEDGDALTHNETSDIADGWAVEGEHILTDGGVEDLESADLKQIEEYFKEYERKAAKFDNRREFEMIESFITDEKASGRKRRETARLLAAGEEVRISAEVAELKKYRFRQNNLADEQELHQKVSDAEKSHATRKMAIAKAAQFATSDCRKQFKRVRDFFQELHDTRKKKLHWQYERSLKIQSMLHRLRNTDPRVMALEQNTVERIFRKKESDMGEINMIQNLEEATYLERIISLLDDVQETKEGCSQCILSIANQPSKCVDERYNLRDAISHRMAMVERNQTLSTQTLQEAIEADVNTMQGAWVEHKRLEEEQKCIFAKAQALISAQVFHEVRNALSSVVAMSEMTASLQNDPTVTSETLASSVSEMLEQNKEVVNYSLNMLNNILDVSKIKSGSFETKDDFFDLQDLVNRATTMQLVKAQTRGVKMSFTPMLEPQIAYCDEDIVVRIITNFISNAVKFTTAGAVQPFVCLLESIDPSAQNKSTQLDDMKSREKTSGNDQHANLLKSGMKLVAVGVADTGPGLGRELLNIAEAGLFSSDGTELNSGAKNSGFGLHLAHQLASTFGSQ
ncbi:hypothetical protein FRACYDRAFT_239643 [Fragilariopsis cylindrus CCMP1102]|uniref:Histidine kinase domain-containing protein n=1 Tax=Fragilariopsis cylindrus CCMP1102 TaxID=635003 RepID=A0A1E7FFU7_9STRA|nr:hypothetical protein FRACYDRAFT_239643 [Fragilariopsis cylindrus CCMP1102]|eukprot:OEU17042.1 hypothetical protein FRACYDRAFT_239643 [Fragilariopsis cylindrus CCMP1102]